MNNINELLACYVGATPEEQLKDLGSHAKTSVRAGKWAWSPRRVAGSLWRTFANGTKMVFNSEARRLLLEKDVNRENYNSLLPVLEAKLGSVHDLSRKDPFFTAETFYETVGLERTLTSNPLGAILIGDE